MNSEKQIRYLSELDKKLTMQCDISFQWNDPLLELSKKLETNAVGFMLYNGSKTEVIYYFPLTIDKSADGKRALTMMGAKKKNDLWTVPREISEPFIKDAINLIMNTPSVTIDMILLEKGILRLRFRFHPNFTDTLSDVVLKVIKENDGFSVTYFGRSRGLLETLLEISTLVPLSGVEFNMKPDLSVFTEDTKVFANPWIRIRKYDSGEFKLHHIYHFCEEVVDEEKYELRPISKEEHLYEANTVSPVIDYLVSGSEKLGIFNNSIHRFDGTIVIGRIWLPTSFVPDYMKILGDARLKFPEWDIGIKMTASIEDVFSASEENFRDPRAKSENTNNI